MKTSPVKFSSFAGVEMERLDGVDFAAVSLPTRSVWASNCRRVSTVIEGHSATISRRIFSPTDGSKWIAVAANLELLRVCAVLGGVILADPSGEFLEETGGDSSSGDIRGAEAVGGQAADMRRCVRERSRTRPRRAAAMAAHDAAGRAADDNEIGVMREDAHDAIFADGCPDLDCERPAGRRHVRAKPPLASTLLVLP